MSAGFGVLDIVIVAVLLLSGLLALMRGFVHEVLSFSAWIGAAVITIYAFPHVQGFTRGIIDIQILADLVSGFAVFLVSLVLLTLLAKLIAELVQGSRLSAIDRFLGLVFGLVRGAALVCLLWLIFAWLVPEPQRPDWIRQAATLQYVQKGALWLQQLLPRSFLVSLGEAAQRNVGETDEDSGGPAPQPSVQTGQEPDEQGYNTDSRDLIRDVIEETLHQGGTLPQPQDSGQPQTQGGQQ